MATPAENLKRFQEIAKRGLQDELPPEIKSRFDAAVERGLVELPPPSAQMRKPQEKTGENAKPSYGEAALSMGLNAAGTAVGGLAGLAQAVNPFADRGAGARASQAVGSALSYKPSAAGQQALENIAPVMQKGMEYARVPVSGIAGLTELATGQGVEQAANTVSDVQRRGSGEVLGDRIMQETNNPELAIAGRMAPDALMALTGMRGGRSAAERIPQTKAKQDIARKIMEKSADTDTARFQLKNPPAMPNGAAPRMNLATMPGGTPKPKNSIIPAAAKAKVESDKTAIRAINQGFTEGAVAAVKASSPKDRVKMNKMVTVMENGKKNELYAMKNRPSDVVGDSLMQRFSIVRKKNQEAGSALDGVAASLKGKPVEFDPIIASFVQKLDEMGIKIRQDLTPDFRGSDIEKVKGAEGAIRNIIARMKDTKVPDGYDVHRLKKFIDEQVTYGKNAKGMSGKVEGLLKGLRHDLDGMLDSKFPAYDKVNSDYANTRGALDALQDVAGKIDLYGPNAHKATGTLIRRLMSNAQSRVALSDAIDGLDSVASKYHVFSDSIDSQMMFVNALDKRFGPVAETSFQGQIIQGAKKAAEASADPTGKGLGDLALDLAGKGYNKLRGVNDERAYKAIRDLLKK